MRTKSRHRRWMRAGLLMAGLWTASTAQAVDWPLLAGTELGRPVSALAPYGFLQVLGESTPLAKPLDGLTAAANKPYNGQTHAQNIDAPLQLSIRRARFGLRGTAPGADNRLFWHLSLEGGQNGLTRDRGVTLLDASVTMRAADWLQLRAGQFKLPLMDEVAQPIPITLPLTAISQPALLLLEQRVQDGQPTGQAFGFRDVGLQLFGRTERGRLEASWAVMGSQGQFGARDTDRNFDVSGRVQLAWLRTPAKRFTADREELSLTAWHLQGRRMATDGSGTVDRVRQGVGIHGYSGALRARVDLVRARGEVPLGRSPATATAPLVVGADAEATGAVASAQWRFAPGVWSTLQYAWLQRDPGPRLQRRDLHDVTAGVEWRPVPKLRLQLDYTHRTVVTPQGVSADARRLAEAVSGLVQVQMGMLL